MESSTLRCAYPETQARLKERLKRHPREDEITDYTTWSVLGRPEPVAEPEPPATDAEERASNDMTGIPKFSHPRMEQVLHKSVSCRRGAGGMFFTNGGGGDGGCAFQTT